MDAKIRLKYEVRAKVIKALAHPARLAIVDQLTEHGQRCVCELTEMLGLDMSTVSRHLSQLKAAGLVEDDKQGTLVYYRLHAPCLKKFFSCIEAVIQADAKRRQEVLELH